MNATAPHVGASEDTEALAESNRTVGWLLLLAVPPAALAALAGAVAFVVTFGALSVGVAAWAVNFAAYWTAKAAQTFLG